MRCAECDAETAEVVGFTEDARTEVRCRSCGFHWLHGPYAEDRRAGRTGGRRFHCPVCPAAFSDQSAPIITIGTPSKAGHRCDRTTSFQLGTTYGADAAALDRRLAEVDDTTLAEWPRGLEMKRERLPTTGDV